MPTNPIPQGSVNFPINMPRELRLAVGRLAYESDMSTGAYLRSLVAEAVVTQRKVCASASDRLVTIATTLAKVSVVAITLTGLAIATMSGDSDMRRTATAVRIVRREQEVA